MKNENKTSIIIIFSIITLSFFIITILINITPNNFSKPYYAKTKEDITTQLIDYSINNNLLELEVTNNIYQYCLKSTKTFPSNNAICWINIDNKTSISLIKGKKYYLWLKNKNNDISNVIELKNK